MQEDTYKYKDTSIQIQVNTTRQVQRWYRFKDTGTKIQVQKLRYNDTGIQGTGPKIQVFQKSFKKQIASERTYQRAWDSCLSKFSKIDPFWIWLQTGRKFEILISPQKFDNIRKRPRGPLKGPSKNVWWKYQMSKIWVHGLFNGTIH